MHRTIRFRITAMAVAISLVLLVGVSLLMATALRRQLTDNLDEGLDQRANTIAAVIGATLPTELSADEDLLIQVVGPNGVVLISSSNLAGVRPITSLRPGIRNVSNVPGRTEKFRVLVREISSGPNQVTLIVGVNDDDIRDPVAILTRILAVTVPAVVLVLGGLTWWLTGRTLRPVEKMRVELAEITGTNLGRRVAEPATGDEIDRLAHTVNETLDRLDGAIRRQQRFVADASHELRSPLTRIRAELEIDLGAGEPCDPTRTEQSVLGEAIYLQHLVDDLLQLARGDDRIADSDVELIDLDDIVFREARRLRERGRVTVDLKGVTPAQIVGDSHQLARAIRNLFDNAERHAASTVTVGLDEGGGRVLLTVSDDGAGISPQDRDAIFERFTRLDDARARDTGGTGLGLAIVRDIIRRHHGTVDLGSGPETRFVVELPLVP
jgi:signal transduction histidine kinase